MPRGLRPLLLAAALLPGAAFAQFVSITGGAPTVESFDSLAASGTGSSLPAGWAFAESGANANTIYTAGSGAANGGDTYSFGTGTSAERALGGIQSGSLVPLYGAQLRNDTGATLAQLVVAYAGEQWRLGTAGRPDRLDFQYSLDATSLTTGTSALSPSAVLISSPKSKGVPSPSSSTCRTLSWMAVSMELPPL